MLNNNIVSDLFKHTKKTISRILDLLMPYRKKNNQYTSLAAKDKIEKGAEYIKALDWAVKQKNVHNIAITGPYGSGKSSIINSFLKTKKHMKVLRLSLAAFNINTNDTPPKTGKGNKEKNKLEEEFLKQIFYSVPSFHIPESRYRRLTPTSWFKSSSLAIVLVFSIIGIIYLYKMEWLVSFVEKIRVLPYLLYILACIFTIIVFVLLICAISYTIKFCEKNLRIKEVDIFNTAIMKSQKDDSNTVFNKYMDEIVYFFEKTKTRLVVIEDIDRFKSTDIFVALRNLNLILNNNKRIKGKVRFIYAIKDDLFDSLNEKIKFFDFIVPVIPYVSSTNSSEVLLDLLGFEDEKECSSTCNISRRFIKLISPYIRDMRTIISICNEFMVFKNVLSTEQALHLVDEKMFSIIAFKNLYPKDYADLEKETNTSIVRKAFDNKRSFFEKKEQLINQYRSDENNKLNHLEKESLYTIRELKSALLLSLTTPPVPVSRIEISNNFYSLSAFLDDSFDINLLHNTSITLHTPVSPYSIKIGDFENKIKQSGDYISRMEISLSGLEDCKELSKSKIAAFERELENNNLCSIKELLQKEDVIFLDDSVKQNDFLVFLLRNGFLDESYEDYINNFHPKSISNFEMNFILGIRNHSSLCHYNWSLFHVAQVYDKLDDDDFNQKEVLNYDLIDYIMKEKRGSIPERNLMRQLSNGSTDSKEFIKSYLYSGRNTKSFIIDLCKINNHFWNDIVTDETISLEKKYFFLNLLLANADLSDVLKQDSPLGLLTEFFTSHFDSLEKINDISVDSQLILIDGLDIVFNDISLDAVDSKIKSFVYSNNRYKLSVFMLEQLFKWMNPTLLSMFNDRNYSAIKDLGFHPLLDRLEGSFAEYISDVFLRINTNTKESYQSINEILNKLFPNDELCILVIDKVSANLVDLSTCCSGFDSKFNDSKQRIWQHLMLNNRLKGTIENVMVYFDEFGFDKAIDSFFIANADELIPNIDDDKCTATFRSAIFHCISDNNVFRSLLHSADIDFDIDFIKLGKEKTKIIIDEDLFVFSVDDYNQIKSLSGDLHYKYSLNNKDEFLSSLSDLSFDETDVITYITSTGFTSKEKAQIINRFDKNKITPTIAKSLIAIDCPFNKELSEAAWPLLNIEQKLKLLILQIKQYTLEEISEHLKDLGAEYTSLTIGKRHQYEVPYNEINNNLLNALKQRHYVTSKKMKSDKNGTEKITGFVKASSIE